MNRRYLLLVTLVVVGLSSVTGVGSVSSVSADRDVSVAVAEDREAFLGIEFGAVENGTTTLTVTNRVSTEALDVTVEDGDTTELQTLGPGKFAEFDVACGEKAHLSAVGPTTEIDATRSVDCPEAASEDRDEDEDVDESDQEDEDGDRNADESDQDDENGDEDEDEDEDTDEDDEDED